MEDVDQDIVSRIRESTRTAIIRPRFGGFGTGRPAAGARKGNGPTLEAQCALWLRRRLGDGRPAASRAMADEARAEGFSARTLQRAKDLAGVVSERMPLHKGWQYRLPE